MDRQQTVKVLDYSDSPGKRKRLFLMLLLYASLFYVYFPLVLCFQDELSESPMVHFLGGILSFVALSVGGILGGLSGFVTGDFYFCKLCGNLLPWDSPELRVILGPLAMFPVPLLFYLKARRSPLMLRRFDFVLRWLALIVIPVIIIVMTFLITI